MSTRIIDGIALSARVRAELAARVERLAARGRRPGLAAIEVGDQPASKIYVRNKIKACTEIGLHSEHIALSGATAEGALLDEIGRLNADPRIHGILVQLPLPGHVAAERVLKAVTPAKDVDCFHPENVVAAAREQLGGKRQG